MFYYLTPHIDGSNLYMAIKNLKVQLAVVALKQLVSMARSRKSSQDSATNADQTTS